MDAVVLLSGGLDSTVALAITLSQGKKCLALSFDYGQRHKIELNAARTIASYYGIPHSVIVIDPSAFSASALAGAGKLSSYKEGDEKQINSSYVPARNTIFLSYALGMAETAGAKEIVIGANADDKEGFPDCRPVYLDAFQNLICLATKQSVEGAPPQLAAPLIEMKKPEIILKGRELKAPIDATVSCYSPVDEAPCGSCQACVIRKRGFEAAQSMSSFF